MPNNSPGGGDSLSDLFETLSNESRRRILVTVAHQNPLDEDELASSIAPEADETALAVLRKELYHSHLPKLDDAGFVDWNRETGTVIRGPRFEEIEPLLTLMDEHRDELPDDWP